jgi:hypothetical protein
MSLDEAIRRVQSWSRYAEPPAEPPAASAAPRWADIREVIMTAPDCARQEVMGWFIETHLPRLDAVSSEQVDFFCDMNQSMSLEQIGKVLMAFGCAREAFKFDSRCPKLQKELARLYGRCGDGLFDAASEDLAALMYLMEKDMNEDLFMAFFRYQKRHDLPFTVSECLRCDSDYVAQVMLASVYHKYGSYALRVFSQHPQAKRIHQVMAHKSNRAGSQVRNMVDAYQAYQRMQGVKDAPHHNSPRRKRMRDTESDSASESESDSESESASKRFSV